LAGGVDVITNQFRDWATLLVGDHGTLLLGNLLGSNAWNHVADTQRSWAAILDWDFLTGLSVGHLAVNLGHLATLEIRNISTLLSGEGATHPGGRFGALGSGNILAFFLLDSLALSLIDIGTFFSGDIPTIFLGNVTALL